MTEKITTRDLILRIKFQCNLNQIELAKALKISRATLSIIENGGRKGSFPIVCKLLKFANEMGNMDLNIEDIDI